MKITIKQTPEGSDSLTTVVPLAKGNQRESVLSSTAGRLGLPLEPLLRDFKAEAGELLPIYSANGRRTYLLGLGENPGFGEILKAFRSFAHKSRQKLGKDLSLHINFLRPSENAEQMVEAAVNGLLLGAYQIGKFKTDTAEKHPLLDPEAHLSILTPSADSAQLENAAARGRIVAEAQLSIFDLVNAPSNKKTPERLAEWARQSGERYGYSVQVLDKKGIQELGLHALLAVNQGSPLPPVFIIMEYRPESIAGKSLKKIGLVGKGVTFDTGGLSIKPSNNMHLMKSDMGGAAAVLGAMEVAARLRLPVHLVGVIPVTDNSVDALSLKPSDVISSYSGKSIEVIDTDAEGRLILADGLSYMVDRHQPDVLIDLATLTGSTVRTLGYHAAGLFSNNDDLAAQLYQLGQKTGEKVWRLPIWDVYKEDLRSDVADVRNFSGKPVAGAIAAAKFLEVFINNHPAWAHLDIAGVAFNDSEFAHQKSATAFGIRLLLALFEEMKS